MRCSPRLAIDAHGAAAVVFAARSRRLPPPLVLVDFTVTGLTASLWTSTTERLRELARTCRAQGGAFLFLPRELVPSAAAAGVYSLPIPTEFDDTGEIALAVAGYVAAGQVKMTAAVNEKAQSSPFRGALDFRSGDVADDPLRHASVLAIVIGLEDVRRVRRAAA